MILNIIIIVNFILTVLIFFILCGVFNMQTKHQVGLLKHFSFINQKLGGREIEIKEVKEKE